MGHAAWGMGHGACGMRHGGEMLILPANPSRVLSQLVLVVGISGSGHDKTCMQHATLAYWVNYGQ